MLTEKSPAMGVSTKKADHMPAFLQISSDCRSIVHSPPNTVSGNTAPVFSGTQGEASLS
jgi:hypothetical protein